MKKLSLSLFSVLGMVAVTLLFSMNTIAQPKKPVLSPADSVSGKIGKANVEIKYSSPSVKGRQILGALIPYGEVWRAGANAATTFTSDKDLNVEGKTLPAGSYSFFVIAKQSGKWTVVFNKVAKQWGAYKYDQAQDALRVDVTPKTSSSSQERLVYVITKKGFELKWEKVVVPVAIK